MINHQDVWTCVFRDPGKRPRENKCAPVVKNEEIADPPAPHLPPSRPFTPPPGSPWVFQRLERRDGRISDRSQREQVFGKHTRLTTIGYSPPFLGPYQLPLPGRAHSAPVTFPAIQTAAAGANASLMAARGRTGSGCRQEEEEVGSRKTERFPAASLGPGTSSLPVPLRRKHLYGHVLLR